MIDCKPTAEERERRRLMARNLLIAAGLVRPDTQEFKERNTKPTEEETE